jgi:hypothetical protein
MLIASNTNNKQFKHVRGITGYLAPGYLREESLSILERMTGALVHSAK